MKLSTEWADTIAEPIPEERIDYDVHFKYVSRIALLSKGLSAKISLKPTISQTALSDLDPKLRLLERTKKSLAEEIRCINEDAEYAHACVAWLPAKVYYNLYHLLSLTEYMLAGNKTHLRIPHHACLGGLAQRITNCTVVFSCLLFNRACDKTILKFRTRSGEVLCHDITDERLISLIMKKIATDKLQDFKARKEIDCRNPKEKRVYESEENKLKISIVDFFYSMRIRTNYKDMSFIDEVDADRTRSYFIEYYEAADNFYNCFNELKNDLIAKIH